MKNAASVESFAHLLVGIFIMILVLMLIVQVRDGWTMTNIVRRRIEVKEAFQMPTKVEDSTEDMKTDVSPADTTLDRPRQPYTLLNDWLETKDADAVRTGAYSAARCHDADFQARLEKTGNFRQMTNNYRRGDPDSCSAPNQEVALGYYKIEEVPFDASCIDRKQWPMQRS
jgi:hypothetical protein